MPILRIERPNWHPVYSNEALAAQQRYDEINGKGNTFFCGAYWGYGFHEDALRSSVELAEGLGVSAPWSTGLPRRSNRVGVESAATPALSETAP